MSKLDFVQVPMSALFKLEGANLKVYAIIYTSCKLNDNKFYHSYKQFADECNLSTRWVKNAVCFLKDNGYIEVESGKGVKSPNVYHIINGEVEFTNNGEVEFTNNGEVEFTNNGEVEFTQKEYIKENSVNKVNNMDYNSSTGRDTTGHSNNNMEFKKNGIELTQNSQTAVQSKDWTKETKEEKTHSSSAGTTKVVQIGDTRYAVDDEEDILSKLPPIPSSSVSKEKKNIHQITTTEDRKDNTLSNASLHNENEDNPMDCGGRSIEDLENMFNGGNPTPTKPSTQALATKYTPRDDLKKAMENMFNGGNPTPTQIISKGGSKTTPIAKSNEGGGGRKFTPRKEWDIAMRVVLQHINNSSDIHNELTTDDVNILYEGASDKYRVIETIKAIQLMLTYRMKFPTYHHLLNDAIDTLEANEEAYTPKQFDYACEIYDDCADRYEKIINNK